jgi:uncharacterized protein YlzI (FlbEa/FlbD family)
MESRMKFTLAMDQSGGFIDVNMDLVFKIEHVNGGSSIHFVNGERVWVKQHPDELRTESRESNFVEFTRKQDGLIVLNTTQIYSVEMGPDDTVQLTMLNGAKYLVDESYNSVCEMLLVTETC